MLNKVQQDVVSWLNNVVIGLNLCPFASRPTRENRVRFQISSADDEEKLLTDLTAEMELLDAVPASDIETTLLIIPNCLNDFYDYTQFLHWAQSNLKRHGWQGVYQLASFHPDYCFAGTAPSDSENLTNRSPYPILHIIREASLEKAISFYENVEGIPERNKECVENLTPQQRLALFPYLFSGATNITAR